MRDEKEENRISLGSLNYKQRQFTAESLRMSAKVILLFVVPQWQPLHWQEYRVCV